jgi:ABC-type multidrug transport system fused ATPase/permease subunit
MWGGLEAEEYDRSYGDRVLFTRILSYFRPQRTRMIVVSSAIAFSAILNALMPIAVSLGIDELDQATTTRNIIIITIFILAASTLSWLMNMVRLWLGSEAIGNVVLGLREDAFSAVLKRDLSFYDSIPSGKIVSRVTSDTQAFASTVTLTVDVTSQLLMVLLLVGYMFAVNITMTLLTLAMAPIFMVTALAFRKIARKVLQQSRRVLAILNQHVQETVAGIRIAKTFRQEHAIYDEFVDVNTRSYKINLWRGYVLSGILPLLQLLAGLGTALLVYSGGIIARDGAISAGEWYLFIQGLALFWFPLTSIASFWSQFQLGLAAGERIFALIDAEPKVIQTDDKHLPETIRGEICFEGVNFSYNEKEQVLQDFSLIIHPGETLALVGHTGAGKSSITRLIARFYEFQEGCITVDGMDIRELNLKGYRAHLGFVTQSPFLFDGTVMDNIRYGVPGATDEQVVAVANQVGGGDWLLSLSDGLQTEVGERGANLSMGQRQLVALARVLLQDPSIFILDEATASVDPLTETLIQEGLEVVLGQRTSIVIAHRLSTIKNADRIIVMQQGKIIEEGNHEELLRRSGHYAELYNTYFRHQSLEYIERIATLQQAGD